MEFFIADDFDHPDFKGNTKPPALLASRANCKLGKIVLLLQQIKDVGLNAHGKGPDAMAYAAGLSAGLASRALDLCYIDNEPEEK